MLFFFPFLGGRVDKKKQEEEKQRKKNGSCKKKKKKTTTCASDITFIAKAEQELATTAEDCLPQHLAKPHSLEQGPEEEEEA